MNNNYRAFISGFQCTGYQTSLSVGLCIASIVFTALASLGGINPVYILISCATAMSIIVLIVILIKKDLSIIFLYYCAIGVVTVLPLENVMINSIYKESLKSFVMICIIVALTFIISGAVCLMIIKHRLKNNYYIEDQSGPAEPISIFCVGAFGLLLGKILGKGAGDSMITIIFLSMCLACILGYGMALNLLKYYYVVKYDLYSAIKFRDD
ncbi:MAG: hypothetical protein PUB09_01555 [Firmicutes bacterium]|nr:hypothetical protein [Bacillota bacterium]